MIWSKLEFEREVRRQLIELESIRKRLPAGSEVHERIDRLEASHKNVLRKLAEVFGHGARPGDGAEAADAAPVPPVMAGLEGYLRAVSGAAGEAAGAGIGGRGGVAVEVESPPAAPPALDHLPSLDARCARCGRVLLTSLLGGEEVVRFEGEWLHAECAAGGEPFVKPGTLN